MKKEPFRIRSVNGLEWIETRRLSQFPWLLHAFSTRRGGALSHADLDFGRFENARSAPARASRRRFMAALQADEFYFAAARQIHSALVLRVAPGPAGRLRYLPSGYENTACQTDAAPCGDALVTSAPGVLVSVRTADCLPVLLADPRTRAVAAIHAGWRGALARIIEKTVGEMRRLFGSQPRQIVAALGPSIRACCYEVGEEVEEAFRAKFSAAGSFFQPIGDAQPALPPVPAFLSRDPPGHAHARRNAHALDLIAVALDQLKSAGVPRSHISVAEFCTSCRNDLFFSARREGQRTGRMIAAIGVRRSYRRRTESGKQTVNAE